MLNFELKKGKHLSIEDRIFIEYALDKQYTLKDIAKRIRKAPTTISKEIKRNRIINGKKRENDLSKCQNQRNCSKVKLCKNNCSTICKKCSMINCYRICPEYSTKKYLKLNRFHYVCNGCNPTTVCQNEKQHYRFKVADANYKGILKSSR